MILPAGLASGYAASKKLDLRCRNRRGWELREMRAGPHPKMSLRGVERTL
jgi:hypothetical protein